MPNSLKDTLKCATANAVENRLYPPGPRGKRLTVPELEQLAEDAESVLQRMAKGWRATQFDSHEVQAVGAALLPIIQQAEWAKADVA